VNILALDLGSRTGWALQVKGRVESGVQLFDVRRGESPGMRYLRFTRWLAEMTRAEENITLIAYEMPIPATKRYSSAASREIASGLATRVQERCAKLGIEHVSVYPSTLKKFATGRGNAQKTDMHAAAVKKFGYVDLDDNEADALWVLAWAQDQVTLPKEGA
jgi:Holliday junction resolvasome RuvABC endonuclease subunit